MEIALSILAGSQAVALIALAWLVCKRLGVPDWKAASYFTGNHIDAYKAGMEAGRRHPQADPYSLNTPIQAPPDDPPLTRTYSTPEDEPIVASRYGMTQGVSSES